MSTYRTFRNTALALMAAGTLATTALPAHAATAPVAGTPINGWVWHLPDGTQQGICAKGYSPQFSEVTDLPHATFWASIGGTTKTLTWTQIQQNIANGALTTAGSWGYNFNSPEQTKGIDSKPVLGHLYEGDCVLDGTALPVGTYHGGGHSQPVHPKVTVTVQVDNYTITTAACAKALTTQLQSGQLAYRGDRACWGQAKWAFTSVTGDETEDNATWNAALNRKTSDRVGDVHSSDPVDSVKVGQRITVAWGLGKGATVAQPWGANHKVPQRFLASSNAPATAKFNTGLSQYGSHATATPDSLHNIGRSRR